MTMLAVPTSTIEAPSATERTARSTLAQLRGRPPTSVELADHLHVNIDVLLAAPAARQAYQLPSLNAPVAGHDTAERFHLVIDVIDRVPGLARRAAVLRQQMVDKRAEHRGYVRSTGVDLPEVRDWTWPSA